MPFIGCSSMHGVAIPTLEKDEAINIMKNCNLKEKSG